jgi:hypothetical protein
MFTALYNNKWSVVNFPVNSLFIQKIKYYCFIGAMDGIVLKAQRY